MEQKSGQRRRLKGVLLICALGVGIFLLPIAAWWMVRYCYVERTVRAFQSNPSQAAADKLTDLLDERSPTQAQAARILKLLLRPVVVTRSAYPIGRKPTISTLLPFRVHFNADMTCRVEVHAGGQDSPTRFSPHYLGTWPQVLVSPVAPNNCGQFSMELRFRYFLIPPSKGHPYPKDPVARFLRGLRDRMIGPPRHSTIPLKKWYQVGFRVPIDINVVPKAEAEQVQLLSSPELDARMRDALRADTSRGQLHIFARRLPANVVFDCFLELPDGTRIRSSWGNRHLIGYTGRDFEVNLWPSQYSVDRSPVHDAKFVFEPDPNYGFEEPTIKSIWNRRLEFPIHFTVAPEPNTGR